MKARIAVMTTSGRAYYLLVSELKKRNVDFLSLTPDEKVPVEVSVVITTNEERGLIEHSNIFEYIENDDPSKVVESALLAAKGKKKYERLVVGVDPGKNFGFAILGDGTVLKTDVCRSVGEAVRATLNAFDRTPATYRVVRIGDGAPGYSRELTTRLNEALASDVVLEIVKEEGTSQSLGQSSSRRSRRDIDSAVKIGQRHGRALKRGR